MALDGVAGPLAVIPNRLSPAPIDAALGAYALAEKADATRRAYHARFLVFSDWCQAQGERALGAAFELVAAEVRILARIRDPWHGSGISAFGMTINDQARPRLHRSPVRRTVRATADQQPPPTTALARGGRRGKGRMTPEASREVGRSLKAMSALLADAGDASGARRMEQQAERYLSGKAEQPRTARLVRFETKSGTIALNPELVQQVSRHPGNADLCEITMLSHKVVVKGELEAVLQALQQDVGN